MSMVRGFESLFEPCQFEASFLVPYPFLMSSFAGACSNVEYRGHSRAYLKGGMAATTHRWKSYAATVSRSGVLELVVNSPLIPAIFS